MADLFKACSVEGCNANANGWKGYCRSHYDRLRKYGDPLAGGTHRGDPLRFLCEVAVPYTGNDCLIWPYSRCGDGYGTLKIGKKTKKAHRHICQLAHGDLPTPKHEAAHSCGSGHLGCVNPQHLSWKTRSENQMDRANHGTSNRGERCATSKLTEPQVKKILLLRGIKSQRAIAVEFGVNQGTVSAIHRRQSWAWL